MQVNCVELKLDPGSINGDDLSVVDQMLGLIENLLRVFDDGATVAMGQQIAAAVIRAIHPSFTSDPNACAFAGSCQDRASRRSEPTSDRILQWTWPQ